MSADVAVVGAGIVGAATARALVRAGAEVAVYEQFHAGHDRGSSHGRTRIVRLAYPEPAWVELAREAFAGWRLLEAEAGERLLVLDGLLEIVRDLGSSSAAALDACGVPWQELDGAAAQERFGLRPEPGERVLLQDEAGCVLAERALAAFLRGLPVVEGRRVESPAELAEPVVVVAAGAWAPALAAQAGVTLPVKVTRETVAFFELPPGRPVPAVIDVVPAGQGHVIYALADPVHGLKAGVHHAGAETDPESAGAPDPALVAQLAEWVGRRFPQARPGPVAAESCLYTTTPDESFVLERRGRVVVGSACSGHGFKFAPAVGARLAALALEAAGP